MATTTNLSVKTRTSGIELLRLISLFSITLCHLLGDGSNLNGISRYFCLIANSGIHAGVGVICFMLITGYFGAHFSLKRLNKTYAIIYVCSIVCLTCSIVAYGFSPMNAIKAIIPVTSGRWWYASCYIYTLLLSPFLDRLAEKIDKKAFQKLLILLITLFYILPTFLYFDINDDKGKGLANMIIIYLLGRYLKMYPIKIQTKALWITMVTLMLVSFGGNLTASVLTGDLHSPFSRDCTIVTLGTSLTLFMLCLKGQFVSKPINFIAKNAFYIYLLDFHMPYLKEVFNLSQYEESLIFIPICLGFVIMVMAISFVLSLILQYPARLIEKILDIIERTLQKIIIKITPSLKPAINILKTQFIDKL